MTDAEPSLPSPRDQIDIVDALYRFGAGVDFGDQALLASVFHDEVVVDFGPCGRKMGLPFPVMNGSETIVGFLAGTSVTQTTTHVITNGRVQVAGETARLQALVDATHIAKGDPSRQCRMMNWYAAELGRHARLWRIRHLVIDNAWFTGDPAVLMER
ncbi:nuclear transport factor 2 family protein [Lichenicoccus sp.]|uniref:nuclear transport factor 2 family protein n=1 Tax=Lichenicoccus sp. TaxID=2781899 RepID=UPI003D1120C6